MGPITLEEELHKNSELTEDDVEHLRQWNRQQTHLPVIPDEQLALFLHSCNWSLEQAQTTIEIHYTLRASLPKVFGEMDPLSPTIQEALSVYEVSPLPERDADGNTLVFLRMRDKDPWRADGINILRLHVMTNMLDSHLQGTCSGYIFLYDMGGCVPTHLIGLSRVVPLLSKFISYLEEGLPVKLKAIHIMNTNWIVNKLVKWAHPFMKKDLLNTVYVHKTGMEEFYNHVPKALLPRDYGGDLGDFRTMADCFKIQLEENEEWYLKEHKMIADESKRVAKVNNSSGFFGLGWQKKT